MNREDNIFIQDGGTIKTLHPENMAKAIIYDEEQRNTILHLIRENYFPASYSRRKRKSGIGNVERGEVQGTHRRGVQDDYLKPVLEKTQAPDLFHQNLMKKYIVNYTYYASAQVEVSADSEDEAREKARDIEIRRNDLYLEPEGEEVFEIP